MKISQDNNLRKNNTSNHKPIKKLIFEVIFIIMRFYMECRTDLAKVVEFVKRRRNKNKINSKRAIINHKILPNNQSFHNNPNKIIRIIFQFKSLGPPRDLLGPPIDFLGPPKVQRRPPRTS